MTFRVLLFAITASSALLAQQSPVADLVLVNGRIYTVDSARPWAEAVSITGDRITAVGTTSEIKRLAGGRAEMIDLKGAFVSPVLSTYT